MCFKFIKSGYKGCPKGDSCKYAYPKICHSSLLSHKCDQVKCYFYHATGTVRPNLNQDLHRNTVPKRPVPDPTSLMHIRTVKENYTVFIEYMEGILAVNIPSKLSNSRHNLPWMNRNFKRLIRKKGRRFKKAKKSGMEEDRARYLDIEQMVKRELRDAERVYVNGILQNGLESGNNKPFWKYVKSQKQESFGISALKSNGNVITDSLSKAEILNSQFKYVFTPQSGNTFPQLPGTQFPKIKSLHISENGVFMLLDRIDVSKSSGPGKLPGRLLQSLAKEITPIVHFIFTQSLCTGELPTEWTQSNVAPIFKKGSKLQAVNYRPGMYYM